MIALWLFNSLLWNITILRTDTPSRLLSMKRVFLILDMKNLLPWFVLYSEPLAEPEFDWNWGILQIKEQRASQPSKNWMFSQKLSDKPILLKNNINTSLFKDSMDHHPEFSLFFWKGLLETIQTTQPEYEWWWATLFRYVNQGWSYQFANPNSNASWSLRSSGGGLSRLKATTCCHHPLGS